MKNQYGWLKAASVWAAAALLTQTIHAQETGRSAFPEPREVSFASENKPHIGIRGGLADPDRRYSGTTEYGVEAGYQPFIPYGAGLELTQYSTSRDVSGGGQDGLTRTKLLFKGTYNFGGSNNFVRHSYLGLAAGPVVDRLNGSNAVNLGWAPMAGFDLPVAVLDMGYLTLGGNAHYLNVGGGKPSSVALNGAVKYWF